MGSGFSAGGLVSGLDSNDIIRQLMQIERQPVIRLQDRIESLEKQQTETNSLLDTLRSLRTMARDFRINPAFSQFMAESTNTDAVRAEVSGENPVTGTFEIDVQQLASATIANSSAKMGAPIDPDAPLSDSGILNPVTAGQFTINGVAFDVDPQNQSLNDVMDVVNASSAGVTMSYDSATDRVTIANDDGSNAFINLGGSSDTSSFLQSMNLRGAVQEDGAATSTRTLGAVNRNQLLQDINFAGGAVTAGSFAINGVTINVDPTEDTLQAVIDRINDSDAQVTASYDDINDAIRVVSNSMGSTTIRFTSNTSNFLDVANLSNANQTAGQNARFTVNGGDVQVRNSNSVSDAIGGVTLDLNSVGVSTVNVEQDDEAIVERVQEFIDGYNDAVKRMRELTGREGALANDSSVRMVESSLQGILSGLVEGAGGSFSSLLEIGISTGRAFDSGSAPTLELNQDAFLEALRSDQGNVRNLFSNQSRTGVADQIGSYLDDVVSTRGFLARRTGPSGTIQQSIRGVNDQIGRLEDRLALREQRLRAQFTQLEQLMSGFQEQSAAVNRLGGGLGMF